MTAVVARLRSPRGRRLVKYSAVSVVSVVVNQMALALLFGVLNLSARSANVLAAAVATVPAFQLNRRWVWRQRGRSRFRREVLPFWLIAAIGLAFSTWAVGLAEAYADDHFGTRLQKTLVVMAGSLLSYGLLWIGRFLILDRLVFGRDRDRDFDGEREDDRG